MQHIYCLSGLGADEQIFKKLEINNAKLIHLPWVDHDEEDTLPIYARRMMETIPETNPIILGVSFGGMLGIEIAKMMPVKKTIIISSAKHKGEISHFDGVMRIIIRTRIAPGFIYKMPSKQLLERFGATTEEEKEIVRGILKRSDGNFMSWAMKAVQLWDNTQVPPNVLHIHGTADKVIEPGPIKPNHWIKGGTHMMIYNRAAEVAALIEKEFYLHGRVGYQRPPF